MDMSMILGFTLAGSIMLLNGNKHQDNDQKPQFDHTSEFVVSVGENGGISISPQKAEKS